MWVVTVDSWAVGSMIEKAECGGGAFSCWCDSGCELELGAGAVWSGRSVWIHCSETIALGFCAAMLDCGWNGLVLGWSRGGRVLGCRCRCRIVLPTFRESLVMDMRVVTGIAGWDRDWGENWVFAVVSEASPMVDSGCLSGRVEYKVVLGMSVVDYCLRTEACQLTECHNNVTFNIRLLNIWKI